MKAKKLAEEKAAQKAFLKNCKEGIIEEITSGKKGNPAHIRTSDWHSMPKSLQDTIEKHVRVYLVNENDPLAIDIREN
jgi:tRNA A37 threonylcarbamoyladenosine dehydratase